MKQQSGIDLSGKRLLVLGGTNASLDLVKLAKDEGVYTLVTDYLEGGAAKDIADETAMVSTADTEGLLGLIRDKNIDGVFCGPSEFQLLNVMNVCELARLPFYATREQWDICSNKSTFRRLCVDYGLPAIPEYRLSGNICREELERIEYPVIVKPVDGRSGRGVFVCNNQSELLRIAEQVRDFSKSGEIIVEKFIQGMTALGASYIIIDGDVFLYSVFDRHSVDPVNRKSLVSAIGVYPSNLTNEYAEMIHPRIKKMLMDLGVRNGVFFLQAMVDKDGDIFIHDVGLRLSGGLRYQIIEPITGVSDMRMMLRFSLGEPMADFEEIGRIDPNVLGKTAASFHVPLKDGLIGKIEGLERIASKIRTLTITQYYQQGDVIKPEYIGTLDQHFARFKFICDTRQEMIELVDFIQDSLEILDCDGNDMVFMRFDTARLC
ncbi:MAG: ATP-grasp domain-containing protein [Clostridiales bacterium]|nr:ATP-grasp domain-containing protein [Clostridiales bacterium]